ncbi:MAG: anti-sigma factor [Halopseudomonas aestusnigri]
MSKERFEGSELLHAYVDGELNASEEARVEQWLDTHPEDAKRVREWQKQNQGVQSLYAGKADQEVPSHLISGSHPQIPATTGPLNKSSMLPRIAAAILFLAIGSLGGWFGHDYLNLKHNNIPLRTVDYNALTSPAMEAHWVYTPEVKHPVEVTSDEQTHLAKWLSYRLEAPLTIPDLSNNGYQLMGGRLLPSRTGPAAQFMYESTEGRRVTVYLSRSDTSISTSSAREGEVAFQFQKDGSTRAFYWYEGPLGYAVIGDMEHNELSQIADNIYQQL